jgi:hypothetical protein
MAHWWYKIPLLALAVWGLGTTALQAQTQTIPVYEVPDAVPGTMPVSQGMIVSPVAQPVGGGCAECMQGNTQGNMQGQYQSGPLKACLNRFGVGCWSHHDEYGCDSFWGQMRFAFGSCRAYFGFHCQNSPPYIPVPEGYSLPPGYWR